jgi:hypothetical protein
VAPRENERRPGWVRPFQRARYALLSSLRLIHSSAVTVARCERHAHRRPIHSTRDLLQAAARLKVAFTRLRRVVEQLEEMTACAGRDPEGADGVPELFLDMAERYATVAMWLNDTDEAVAVIMEKTILAGLLSGEIQPEVDRPRRTHIDLIPRPAPVRAFLRARLPRVRDRISALLDRRRRTARPLALSIPRETSQGRAPPLSSTCLL